MVKKFVDVNELDLYNYGRQVTIVDESIANEWIREYQKTRDNELEQKILDQYFKFILKRARDYSRSFNSSSYEFSDLFLEGYCGFKRALDLYDPDSGNTFLTYADHWITMFISSYTNINYFPYRVPHYIGNALKQAIGIKLDSDVSGDPFTPEILMEKLNLSKEIATILYKLSSNNTTYLDEYIGDPEDEFCMADLLMNEDPDYAMIAAKSDRLDRINAMIDKTLINEKERDIIRMRYGFHPYVKPYKLKEIGEKYGISRERVRQLEARAIKRLSDVLRSKQEYYDY